MSPWAWRPVWLLQCCTAYATGGDVGYECRCFQLHVVRNSSSFNLTLQQQRQAFVDVHRSQECVTQVSTCRYCRTSSRSRSAAAAAAGAAPTSSSTTLTLTARRCARTRCATGRTSDAVAGLPAWCLRVLPLGVLLPHDRRAAAPATAAPAAAAELATQVVGCVGSAISTMGLDWCSREHIHGM